MNLLHTGTRRHVAVAAVVSMVATVLAAVGLTASPASAADVITFRAGAEATYNQPTARVTIPAAVRETDGMLLFVTKNNAAATVTVPPAGWALEGQVTASTDTQTFLYSKVAVANDAGRNAAVTFSATTKSTITLLAYDGTAADPVSAFASAAETVNRATHTTPVAQVGTAGSLVVSYWADKSASLTTGWTLPAGQTQRSIALGTGAGRITSVASDSNAPSGVGPTTARTATGAVSTAKATMWTVVLQADQTVAPNVAPVASFTVSCPQATCTVDASGSTDTAPGTVSSYAWDFGDGTTGTGVSTTHTYATGGAKTITLRVTDNQGLVSAPATRTANPTVTTVPSSGQPNHNRLVPDRPRTNTPRISNGEIWDIEVVPALNRVFIAGNFTSLANTISPTTTINQAGLASYNYQTGLIDTSFRPTFNGGVSAVEVTPDGTKLFVGGSFNTVNGVAKQKVASLNLTTGAPLSTFGFTNSTNNQVQSLAATNSTLYVGGRYTRINGQLRTGLAAVNAASGVVDMAFDNQLAGGIGVNGQLGVPQLKLTHDESKLLVVHTGRQIDGQDRLGMGIIDTATKELLPWRSQLWDENLARVGGVTRIYGADIAPDDSYFVVTSGSGGDAPPISDTAIRYPLTAAALQDSDVQPAWISRHFDSIYSVAITEVAVYVGGHFGFIESPSSDDPWPGLDNVGYGTGQGLAGYGLGDQVVRRDHIAALSTTTGKALEWNPNGGSNSFEGDKAMEATPRGLFIGGDGMFKGGVRTGRVGFFDFNSVTNPPALPDTTITTPIEGRVVATNTPFEVTGTARVATGSVGRVQVRVQDRDSGQFLTSGNTWTSTATSVNATLGAGTTTRSWTLGNRVVTTNRNLLISAQAFTAAVGGTGDSTQATKKIESFGLDDQTPTTGISGPSGIQTSTTFTVTGTANDDKGVNSLSFWFRDEQNRYLQADGTVDDIFNTFRGTPDVIGATAATWSYEVTLPHEGVWRGSATATDTIGQADLRSATRDWTVDSTAVSPTVTIAAPVSMTPPFTVPALTVEPGGRMTFSGTATDDEGLKNVEVTFRNSSTGENLGNDCSWGLGISAGACRVSAVDIAGSTYNWSWTTPANMSPGTYTFTVRATDDEDLTTSSANRGSLTVNAQYAGDLAPDGTMAFTAPTDKSLIVNLAGTATDDVGLESVRVSLQDRDTGRYLQANGTMAAAIAFRNATLTPATGTAASWSLPAITLPSGGNWRFTAITFDSRGQQDPTPAQGNYRFYPGDGPPTLSETLGQPVSGTAFTDGKIVVTGRAEDAPDASAGIASVRIGVVNAAGQYMGSTGTFTSTTASFRTAFLNSPGSAGSNYSFTTPVIPAGTYTVLVQSVDVHDQLSDSDPVTVGDQPRASTGVTVSQPANNPPVASFTYSCTQNVCTFDGRGSTDENTASLTYSWNFGTQGTATGPLPTRTFTAPGTFPVTLTVRDEWTLTHTTLPVNVVIAEPTGNSAPVPTFTQSCQGLTCAVSSAGTADPNTGDVVSYSWNWGDGTAVSTGASPAAHVYAAAGNYTITLTTTDGWGRTASTTRNVSLSEPAGNTAPTAAFTVACTSFTQCTTNSSGTQDAQGDALRYSWNWGDASTPSTTANPTKTYTSTGTYTIVLSVTDVWGKVGTATRTVTITEPAGNTAPTAGTVAGSCTTTNTTCTLTATGSSDPDTASGDAIRNYVWSWGDGTPDTTGTSAGQSHVFPTPGTYVVTLRVLDKWGRASAPVTTSVSTAAEPAGNAGPVVTFNQPVCTGRTCAVSSAGTTDAVGGIRSYTWTWADGTPDTVTTSTNTQSHVYAAAGTYVIRLVATDNWGRTTTVTRTVTIT
ncbi:beta strand repeat-containing protein [Nocardioides terrigena]|uniref:beta strand repeat-containing protein n=1 Tax=Nocardioides terrigena TaxID=424797 RepID=UPI000D30BC94|nr:PKD domain-containing protein [Nocardioides terrigena]